MQQALIGLLCAAVCATGFAVGSLPASHTACTAREELCIHIHFTVNTTYFQIAIEGQGTQNVWFEAADMGVGGASVAGGQSKLSGDTFVRESGSDQHGPFTRLVLKWKHPNGKAWHTGFRVCINDHVNRLYLALACSQAACSVHMHLTVADRCTREIFQQWCLSSIGLTDGRWQPLERG